MVTVGLVGGCWSRLCGDDGEYERYIKELLEGDFRDETREQFVSLITRMGEREEIDGVILGGTELPLLLSSSMIAGIPVLDTTALHVAAIVERLRR
jgi:aspartate racemase